MNRSLTMTKRAEWGLSFLSALGCLSVLAAMLVAIPAAQAQVLYGSVVGRVNDPSGGAVPGGSWNGSLCQDFAAASQAKTAC